MLLLREAVLHSDPFDMTMTMLRMKQFEACERRLAAFPQTALFSKTATNADAQALLMASFDNATDLSKRQLLTIQELRAAVLSRLPLEARHLEANERYLLMVLMHEGGSAIVEDPARFGAVESLAKRLWCTVKPEGEGWQITLSPELQQPLEMAYQQWIRDCNQQKLHQFDNIVFSLLYTAGLVDEARPMEIFLSEVMQRDDWMAYDVAKRYLKSKFDYITDGDGKLILLHPALVDPERMLLRQRPNGILLPEMEQYQMGLALSLLGITIGQPVAPSDYNQQLDILPGEVPTHHKMTLLLTDAVRPDYEPDECAEDLRLLVKQDYSYEEIFEAMKAMLVQLPTRQMETVLTEMYQDTPRWVGLKAARLQ